MTLYYVLIHSPVPCFVTGEDDEPLGHATYEEACDTGNTVLWSRKHGFTVLPWNEEGPRFAIDELD